MKSLYRQTKAHMVAAMVARRKDIVIDARNLMTLRMNRIVNDIVYSRVRDPYRPV
jgi:hypothetical protein